ncbi:helix-turn-helix domain-containing protein [candidate division KSB1 bacterium]|nr:helix-turn-helix domain-containing protein [candidate division KSB1 bacterium]
MELVMRQILTDEMLTLKEAQQLLKVSKRTIIQMVKSGELHVDPTGQWVSKQSCCFHSWTRPGSQMENGENIFMQNITDQERDMISEWT